MRNKLSLAGAVAPILVLATVTLASASGPAAMRSSVYRRPARPAASAGGRQPNR